MSYLKLHPLDCCIYPKIYNDDEIISKCKEKCQNSDKDKCGRICYLNEIGAYVDGKFKPEGIKKMFENGCNDTEKAKESTKGPLDDSWADIIDESIKSCDKEYSHDAPIPENKISNFIHLYQVCLRTHNYLSCPNMTSSSDCDDIKNLIKSCDKNTRETLFGAFHEPRRHLQKEGAAAGNIGAGGQLSKSGKKD